MPTITLEGIPAELYDELERRARKRNRSLSSEAIACLRSALEEQDPSADEILTQAREFRERVRGHLTDADLAAYKSEGRL